MALTLLSVLPSALSLSCLFHPLFPGPLGFAEPHLISMETVPQLLEMPVLLSVAKWFDPCIHIKTEKLSGSLINQIPLPRVSSGLGTRICDLPA